MGFLDKFKKAFKSIENENTDLGNREKNLDESKDISEDSNLKIEAINFKDEDSDNDPISDDIKLPQSDDSQKISSETQEADAEVFVDGDDLSSETQEADAEVFVDGDDLSSETQEADANIFMDGNDLKDDEEMKTEEPTNEEDSPKVHMASDLASFEDLIAKGVRKIELGSDLTIGGVEIDADGMTIDGKGHTIFGEGEDGIFIVSAKDITFRNITFSGGSCGNEGRDAERNHKRTSRSEDLNFNYYGGAIYVPYSGDCTFIKCNFNDNVVGNKERALINRVNVWYEAKGGAIYSRGKCKLISCNFRDNETINGSYADFYGCEEAQPIKECKHKIQEEDSISDEGKNKKIDEVKYEMLKNKKPSAPQNFKYLDALIHLGEKEIILDCDIILEAEEEESYKDGILIDIDDITIDGNGHSISAEQKARIFKITGKDIILKNITLKNGYSEVDGGAIYNLGTASLQDVIFSENAAKYGGALYNSNGELILENDIFTNNKASWFGGAIHNDNGEISLKDNRFTDNKAQFYGGAISNWGKITAKHDIHMKNEASEDGGAIYNNYDLKLFNCEFSNNSSPNSIVLNRDLLEIHNAAFNLNQSSEVICNEDDSSNAYLYNCKFKDSAIERSIIYNEGKSCIIEKCVFESHISNDSKNIINQSNLTFKNSIVMDNGKSILNNGYILVKESAKDIEERIEGEGNCEIFESVSNEERFDFAYLDKKIHECNGNEIILEEDIIFENYERDFYEGGIELDIDNLVIDGNGHTIDGQEKSRIFIITGNDITLKNIIFKNGYSHKIHYNSPNNHGGAIRINHKNKLAIENCRFLNNLSEDNGGAINNEHGMASIKDTELIENTARGNGGAIRNGATCIIDFSSLNGNESGLVGGSIDNKGELSIGNCELVGNNAGEHGGAINNLNSCVIDESVLRDNGAGLVGGSIDNKGELSIGNCELVGNNAGEHGGAINNLNSCVIDESVLRDNGAGLVGGSIDNKGELSIGNCELVGNNAGEHGGAINNDTNGKVSITNTMLEQNKTTVGVPSTGYMRSYGGAISNFGTAIIKNSTLTKNEAYAENRMGADSSGHGGAIYNDGKMQMENASLTQNASQKIGGAIDNSIKGIMSIDKIIFRKNEARMWGGAIYNGGLSLIRHKREDKGIIFISQSSLEENKAFEGGAIYNRWNCDVNITDSTLKQNKATIDAAAILNDGRLSITESTIAQNEVERNGAAIHTEHYKDLSLSNCNLYDNQKRDITYKNYD